ncbi:MAG TPA: hypothetical protein PLU87_18155 [Sedimentisphaerales bacterium]|nr:hypothetical protein [Sedimentisphaerales bacterium]HRS12985.1 hypothetical protein [Sedimentisphaerales bacterium]HRV49593.1 hypothetical protein [Sedimentisphaerales bacterium]
MIKGYSMRIGTVIIASLVGNTPFILAVYGQEKVGHSDELNTVDRVAIARPILDVRANMLNLRFELANTTGRDIWICESMSLGSPDFEAFMRPDEDAIIVRRRLGIHMEGCGVPPTGRYVLLRNGEHRSELLSLTLPVRSHRILTGGVPSGPLKHATRFLLEVGYYDKDLPGAVLPKAYLNLINESVQRNQQVLIPYQFVEDEQVLRIEIKDMHIPYLDEYERPRREDIALGTRLDIDFKPSALPFLFPCADDQALLSEAEQERLRSLTSAAITDSLSLKALAENFRAAQDAAFICEDATATVVCSRDGDRVASVVIDQSASVMSERGEVFRCRNGLPSLRAALPGVQSLDLRVSCGHNLQNLWCRLRSANTPPGVATPPQSETKPAAYPMAERWCDSLVRPYQTWDPDGTGRSVRPFRCPSAGDGRCHYAMNPDCEPDSPGDTVLLFETKAGWNQHGGPELFTFDNHDPKGGCVLLNDGTVKFIRTEEELRAFRWK